MSLCAYLWECSDFEKECLVQHFTIAIQILTCLKSWMSKHLDYARAWQMHGSRETFFFLVTLSRAFRQFQPLSRIQDHLRSWSRHFVMAERFNSSITCLQLKEFGDPATGISWAVESLELVSPTWKLWWYSASGMYSVWIVEVSLVFITIMTSMTSCVSKVKSSLTQIWPFPVMSHSLRFAFLGGSALTWNLSAIWHPLFEIFDLLWRPTRILAIARSLAWLYEQTS